LPLFEQISTFESLYKKLRFSSLLEAFGKAASLDNTYFMCDFDQLTDIAKVIDPIPLSSRDRYTYCIAPIDCRDAIQKHALIKLAMKHFSENTVKFFLTRKQIDSYYFLKELESCYKVCELYLWLSYRFEQYEDSKTANNMKRYCSQRIETLFGTTEPR